jgi:hypothetical protein
VSWLVRRVPVGTAADTPASLRAKAREFLRLAGTARDPAAVDELNRLAERYRKRATELEVADMAARAGVAVKGRTAS